MTERGLRSVVVALGSNVGDRRVALRRAIRELGAVMSVVRCSSVIETEPVDTPAGSPRFLNMVVAGYTDRTAISLLRELQAIESRMGRVRRRRNAPRIIDLDLIVYSAEIVRSKELEVPHPRFREREFVMRPLRELGLPWVDPVTHVILSRADGEGSQVA